MIYHVLPGDSLVEEFKKTNIDGEVIVCREALISGPIEADSLDDFWQQRARFILTEYGEDEIEYHDKVAAELNKLTEITSDDEVNLWFEYELFCSVNYWFCLSLLKSTGATIYRVEPIGLDEDKRWDGFGYFAADDLIACFEMRHKLSGSDADLGADLWQAYRRQDERKLIELSSADNEAFPCLRQVVAAANEQDIQPREILRMIASEGEKDFAQLFAEFKKRAGVYGYGDLQVQRLLDQLSL
ncbi:MAG: DUF1835 domain-containing protein [Pyrinomonadaceae bacterium]